MQLKQTLITEEAHLFSPLSCCTQKSQQGCEHPNNSQTHVLGNLRAVSVDANGPERDNLSIASLKVKLPL